MSDLAALSVTNLGTTRLVTVTGEIDMSNAQTLEERVLQSTPAAAAVVVNLTGVTFIDSAGVRMLDHLLVRGAVPPEAVRVVTAGAVRTTLRLCGFRPELIADSVEDALRALGDERGAPD